MYKLHPAIDILRWIFMVVIILFCCNKLICLKAYSYFEKKTQKWQIRSRNNVETDHVLKNNKRDRHIINYITRIRIQDGNSGFSSSTNARLLPNLDKQHWTLHLKLYGPKLLKLFYDQYQVVQIIDCNRCLFVGRAGILDVTPLSARKQFVQCRLEQVCVSMRIAP